MPLQKLMLKPGVNRENTRYTNEGGWYESDKVRFRQGTPEKIGGWLQISGATFLGICRSLWNWVTLAGQNLLGVGTNLKFYIETGGAYYDITPIRAEITLVNPFTTNGTTTVTVTDAAGGFANGDYVTFYGGSAVGGQTITGQYQITYLTSSTYTITISAAATAATGGGTVYAVYQVTTGSATYTPIVGWGAGSWGAGAWGVGSPVTFASSGLRIWNQMNWGQNLLYGPRNGPLYYWDASVGYLGTTQVSITSASPCVVSYLANSLSLLEGTPITLYTSGALPTGLLPGTVYYVKYLSSSTFNLTSNYATLTASCSGAGTNTLSVTEVTSGTVLAAGMTVYYYSGGVYNSLGTLSFTGTGTGGAGTYSVSAGTSLSSGPLTAGTLINTSSTGTGVQYISPRGIPLTSLPGSDGYCPLYQSTFTISDASRFLIVFGTNDIGSTTIDPMLIRWSDQESLTTWYPQVTNQAGSVRLSHGSEIITTLQSRQEIVVWTDSSLYSLQYLGPPYVWQTQILADNISIIGPNAAAMASGVSYWMGVDKFYKYDGRVQTLRCDLRQYIYSDINLTQAEQVFGSTNEGFNEVWWFYCSASSSVVDKYVIYNYLEDTWYYGSMGRTAWLDTGLRDYPIAATYSNNIVQHEDGVDDGTLLPATAITASITSAQYDIGDGHNLAFVYRMLPDLTFRGSASGNDPSGNPYPSPTVTMYLQGLNNSGSGITQTGNAAVTYNGPAPSVINVDEYTGQIYIRIRGRQMQMKLTSNTLGTQWQLGAPRIDMRSDGRR